MTKVEFLKVVEDIADSTVIPLSEYRIMIGRNNGDYTLNICRHDNSPVDHMYDFSEIFNSVTQEWRVEYHDNRMYIFLI